MKNILYLKVRKVANTLKLASIFHTTRTSLLSVAVDLRGKVKEHVSSLSVSETPFTRKDIISCQFAE